MFLHPGYDNITVAEGGSGTCVYVFQIAEGLTVDDITASYEIQWNFEPPTMERDDSLL